MYEISPKPTEENDKEKKGQQKEEQVAVSIECNIEQNRKERIAIARELWENQEKFLFPGIDPDFYSRTKADEEEFPGYVTPIDELIRRFEDEGIKVALGKDPEIGNIYILPMWSNDIENDSIFPQFLQIDDAMDERLARLILLARE